MAFWFCGRRRVIHWKWYHRVWSVLRFKRKLSVFERLPQLQITIQIWIAAFKIYRSIKKGLFGSSIPCQQTRHAWVWCKIMGLCGIWWLIGGLRIYPAIWPIHTSNIPKPSQKLHPSAAPACALSLGASPSRTRAEKTSPNHRREAQQRDLRMWFSSKKSQKAWNSLSWMVVCKICLKVSYYTILYWHMMLKVGSRIAFDILWYCRVQSNLADTKQPTAAHDSCSLRDQVRALRKFQRTFSERFDNLAPWKRHGYRWANKGTW